MTNPAPAPQPDLRQRIAEMFPCICTPPFKDGAHWHDCPTGFRKEVEELVCELERERDEARGKLAEVQKLAGSLRDGPFMQMASQIEAALGAESPRKDAAESGG